MTIEELEKQKDIPKCDACGNPIYNPDFWDTGLGMCGPCTTGEANTLFQD
jgi:formylmethanofuran dehydrogenase subunit E